MSATMDGVLAGVDASRRAGWAHFYAERQRFEVLEYWADITVVELMRSADRGVKVLGITEREGHRTVHPVVREIFAIAAGLFVALDPGTRTQVIDELTGQVAGFLLRALEDSAGRSRVPA